MPLLYIAIGIVGGLIAIVGLVSGIISICLAVSYVKYNRRENEAGLTGEQAARQLLDRNGLQHIKVKVGGSILFGNSYSHYFKKVRLRRLTRKKTSLTSLAMGSQKAALAVMDKEGDPDMRRRIKLVPIITFGPFAFIPLLIVGALIDVFLFNMSGWATIAVAALAIVFYALAFALSCMELKTEKKAQQRAYELLRENGMATEEELAQMSGLFHLYNIQYVNDMILAALEFIYYILRFVALIASKKGDSRS